MAYPTTSTYVIDVDESTFQRDVVDRSRQTPVVVDFWAPWCGPCRMLSPTLEGLAKEHAGRFILAKVNVDENQGLAIQFGVQGIPAVKAFRDGRVASEFVGAQPQPAVRKFIADLLPSELDVQVAQGRRLLDAGQYAQAEAALRSVLAAQPDHAAASLGLARALMGQGQDAAALETLAAVPLGTPEGNEAQVLRQQLQLRSEASGADEAALNARLAASPDDLDSRFTLASLQVVQGRYEEAMENYLAILRKDRRYRDGAARQAMLHVFDLLGEVPLARTYRQRLASVLFV